MPIKTLILSDDTKDATDDLSGGSFDATQTDATIDGIGSTREAGFVFLPSGGWGIPQAGTILEVAFQLYHPSGAGNDDPFCQVFVSLDLSVQDFAADATLDARFDGPLSSARIDGDTVDHRTWRDGDLRGGTGYSGPGWTDDVKEDDQAFDTEMRSFMIAAVQEVINLPSWSPTSTPIAIYIAMKSGGGNSYKFNCAGHASASTQGPKLAITWAANAKRTFGRTVA